MGVRILIFAPQLCNTSVSTGVLTSMKMDADESSVCWVQNKRKQIDCHTTKGYKGGGRQPYALGWFLLIFVLVSATNQL